MIQIRPYFIDHDGELLQRDGTKPDISEVNTNHIEIDHLKPRVITYQLAREQIICLVTFSCHCWTCAWDHDAHDGQLTYIDHNTPRAFDHDRFRASYGLPDLIGSLMNHRVYVTPERRNYGCYNASLIRQDGTSYTAYFKVDNKKGWFDETRHRLSIVVESAYHSLQPEVGSKTNMTAVLASARNGKMVKYRP